MINIYKDYSFMDANDYKYTLSVENDFVNIEYYERNDKYSNWERIDVITISTNFMYEIAKTIIKEVEENNFVKNK